MDRSAVKAIVEAHIDEYKEILGIAHWHITVGFDLRDPHAKATVSGECTWYIDYERAAIRLDPDALDSEEEVLEVLRHELMHIVIAPISVFWNMVKPLLKDDPTRMEMANSVHTHSIERCIINLERMYQNLSHKAGPCPTPSTPSPSSSPAVSA
jgi:hypothetical protein